MAEENQGTAGVESEEATGALRPEATGRGVEYMTLEEFPGYRVGDDGSIWSQRKGRVGYRKGKAVITGAWKRLLPYLNGSGYFQIHLAHRSGKIVVRMVHHLVLLAFIGPRPSSMEGCHNNGRQTDNRLANLRWDTRKSNAFDKTIHGTQCRGENHGQSKLTEAQAREILTMNGLGLSAAKVGLIFGVSKVMVLHIWRGRRWRHLEGVN